MSMHSYLFKVFLASLVSSIAYIANCHAGNSVVYTQQVKAELIASVNTISPGQELWLGLEQTIIPHWHTYWKNPGDSGIATRIDYELPPGSEVGALQWPTPSKFSLGPVVNFGYAGQVTLLTPVKLPENLKPGQLLAIKAHAKWLVCEEICIPQEVELAIELPIEIAGASDQQINPVIAQALKTLPVVTAKPAVIYKTANGLNLKLTDPELVKLPIQDAFWFPDEWGAISHSAPQTVKINNEGVEISLVAGDNPAMIGDSVSGVLKITRPEAQNGSNQAYQLKATVNPVKSVDDPSLAMALVLALLGGISLNLMPCVFPVLSIKALGLIKQTQQSATENRKHGWIYTLGVLSCFLIIALVLISFKSAGQQIGWGVQFQSPYFVLLAAYLTFAVGLSLSGLFSIGESAIGFGHHLTETKGYLGSLFTGMLAAIVATPCTAPFMGVAIGFALTQSALTIISVFLSLGLGLAMPYLMLTNWPKLQVLLPKPGLWMALFKQFLAFPMYAASIWLIWVLAQQTDANTVLLALIGLLTIAFTGWLFSLSKTTTKYRRLIQISIVSLLINLIYLTNSELLIARTQNENNLQKNQLDASNNWENFSSQRLINLRAEGRPVFVNFTAAWCISCLVNEKVALSNNKVKQAIKQQGITYLKGDWTNRNPEISSILNQYGRSGVPLYLYFPPGHGKDVIILPQILTPEQVVTTFLQS